MLRCDPSHPSAAAVCIHPISESPSIHQQDTGTENYHDKILQFIDELQRRVLKEEPEDIGLFDIISKSLDAMQNTIARFKLAAYAPDIIVNIPSNSSAFYEFYRANELIALGREKAAEACNDT